MKLIEINIDYYLLQFHALKFFFSVRLHGGYLPNFNVFNAIQQIQQQNGKVHYSNCLNTNFHIFSDIILYELGSFRETLHGGRPLWARSHMRTTGLKPKITHIIQRVI